MDFKNSTKLLSTMNTNHEQMKAEINKLGTFIDDIKNVIHHKNSTLVQNKESCNSLHEKLLDEKIIEINSSLAELKNFKFSITSLINEIKARPLKNDDEFNSLKNNVDLLQSEYEMIFKQFSSTNSELRVAMFDYNQMTENLKSTLLDNSSCHHLSSKSGSLNDFKELHDYKNLTMTKKNFSFFPKQISHINKSRLFHYKFPDESISQDLFKTKMKVCMQKKMNNLKLSKSRKTQSMFTVIKKSTRTNMEPNIDIFKSKK